MTKAMQGTREERQDFKDGSVKEDQRDRRNTQKIQESVWCTEGHEEQNPSERMKTEARAGAPLMSVTQRQDTSARQSRPQFLATVSGRWEETKGMDLSPKQNADDSSRAQKDKALTQ